MVDAGTALMVLLVVNPLPEDEAVSRGAAGHGRVGHTGWEIVRVTLSLWLDPYDSASDSTSCRPVMSIGSQVSTTHQRCTAGDRLPGVVLPLRSAAGRALGRVPDPSSPQARAGKAGVQAEVGHQRG
jgi:hypothetical protein